MDEISAERVRIARELHDGIAQDVASIGFRIDVVLGNDNIDAPTRTQLRLIRNSITNVGELLRDEIHELRNLPGRPFGEIVEELAENNLRPHSIEFELNIGEEPQVYARFHLQRVVQEILFNVIQHSSATKVFIVISGRTLEIKDNGRGFSAVEARRWGLIGITERMKEISGRCDMTSDESGTRFVLSW